MATQFMDQSLWNTKTIEELAKHIQVEDKHPDVFEPTEAMA
jgi:hypothetical protein